MQRDEDIPPDNSPPEFHMICAWCRKSLDPQGGHDRSDCGVTHGICPDCLRKVLHEIGSSGPPPGAPPHDSL